MRDRRGLLGLDEDARQVLDRPLDRLRRGRVRRTGVLDPERPDRGAAQANQVGAAPERPADVGHQHPRTSRRSR